MSINFKNINVNIVLVIGFGMALVAATSGGIKIVNDLSDSIKENKIYIDQRFVTVMNAVERMVRLQEVNTRQIESVQQEAHAARKEANFQRYTKADADKDQAIARKDAEIFCLQTALLNAHIEWKCQNPNAQPVQVYTANYGNWWAGTRVEKAK